ncbi:hypothetical protein WMW71_05320 [Flavobacterium buctense]|uniref:DUF4178 domain-containing protein n=1 Tax=Flavobacterium buctense TaxID=1648146 RepID=A0ABU9DZC5_9FLAO|nr:hypothetical protein [Flavobacterium buctense]
MEPNRNWKKIAEGKYLFLVGEKKIGELELQYSNWKRGAIFNIEGQIYTIEHFGFWKDKFQIADYKGVSVLKGYTDKWFSSQTTLDYQNTKLLLKIRNNPLAEFVITNEDSDLLSYSLETNGGTIVTKIISLPENKEYLLDFLLWYLFQPIAQENAGDHLVFQSLLMSL